MATKEYAVIVKKGINLEEVDNELSREGGDSSCIPERPVEVANPRTGSKRMTHWYLTDEEAQTLANDTRIEAVEIPPDQRTDIQIGKRASQAGDFRKPEGLASAYINWGLRRCIESTNVYSNSLTATGDYEYAIDGTGVDVVIQDSGIQADHPDFNNYDGVSRVRQIDWYTESGLPGAQNANFYSDTDGHGTHCAGIVAGLTYGWAKNADIYAQKLAGLEGPGQSGQGISIADCFDAIRLWHAAKTNGRPTVVNMSWGYFSQVGGNPASGTYRGTPWVFGVDYANDNDLWTGVGVVPPLGASRFLPARVASVDAEVDDLIAAGVHVFIAAGNDYYKGDVSTGTDYNNSVVFGAQSFNYHRGSSPHSDEAFIVGNIDTDVQFDGANYLDKTAESSSRGPRVNMWAPGTNIASTCSTASVYATANYPGNANFRIANISGTSFAAPNVCGVAALHLQSQPNLTPAQLKAKMEADALGVMFTTGNDADYASFSTSLLGASRGVLFSRYGRQPFNLTGSSTINLSGS